MKGDDERWPTGLIGDLLRLSGSVERYSLLR